MLFRTKTDLCRIRTIKISGKSGLVQYPAGQDNWFIVQNGVMDSSYNGFAYYNGGLFFVARGRLVRKDGLVQDPHNKNDWYFLANGQVQSKKTGNVTYNGKTFYVSEVEQVSPDL